MPAHTTARVPSGPSKPLPRNSVTVYTCPPVRIWSPHGLRSNARLFSYRMLVLFSKIFIYSTAPDQRRDYIDSSLRMLAIAKLVAFRVFHCCRISRKLHLPILFCLQPRKKQNFSYVFVRRIGTNDLFGSRALKSSSSVEQGGGRGECTSVFEKGLKIAFVH